MVVKWKTFHFQFDLSQVATCSIVQALPLYVTA
jgi:hypothetical protein